MQNKLHNTKRLPVAGVMGSGSQSWQDRTSPLGVWLAENSFHLLTGGGSGVMESVSKAFHQVPERRGNVIGIIPFRNQVKSIPQSQQPYSNNGINRQ
ncbi:MAG: hypothetical protein HQK83_03105 [Fibrobacteria bacterium]|nr:hypothetical protein [Fibrobacteria bacterium]